MKLKNICFGIVCTAVLVGCTDKMDYHEYTATIRSMYFLTSAVHPDL